MTCRKSKMVGYIWSRTASMSTLKYFLVYSSKYKAKVHQFDFIWSFLQDSVNQRVFKRCTEDMDNTSHNMATIWNTIDNKEVNV